MNMFDSTALPSTVSVGIQYAEWSSTGLQVVSVSWKRLSVVVFAFVDRLPKNECMCDAPGMPGKTIGSFCPEWL